MKDAILFFDMGNTSCLPVIKAVCEKGYSPVVNDQELLKVAQEAGLPILDLANYTPEGNLKRAQQDAVQRINGITSAVKKHKIRQAFSSVSGEFLSYAGEDFFRSLYGILAGEIMVIEALKSLTRRLKLKLIVLGCDNSHIQRAIVGYASTKNIPTLQIAHGLFTKSTVHFSGNIPPLYSESIAVFGKRSQDIFVEHGTEPERVVITGSPSWDSLYKSQSKMTSHEARGKLELDLQKPVILYCASYAEGISAIYSSVSNHLYSIHDAVIQAAKELGNDVQFIVRPHPNELKRANVSNENVQQITRAYHEWLASKGATNVHLLMDRKIEAINAADVVIAINNSSMIPESMILQRPVVKMSLREWDSQTYTNEDGIEVIEEYDNLPKVLEDLIANPDRRDAMVKRQNDALPDLNYKNDGKSTERISQLILTLANRSRENKASRNLWPTTELNKDKIRSKRNSNTKLRILEVIHSFLPFKSGGTELYTFNLSKELQKLGHDVLVLFPFLAEDKKEFSFNHSRYNGIPIVMFNLFESYKSKRSEFLNLEYDQPFRDFLKNNKFDIVHFQHLYGLSVNWLSIAKESGAKVVLKLDDFYFYCKQIHLIQSEGSYCSGPESLNKCIQCCYPAQKDKKSENLISEFEYRNETLKSAFSIPDLVHTPSRFAKESHQKNGFVNSNFKVIPTGILPFKVLTKTKAIDEKIRIAYVGAIDRRKGVLDFIRAIEHFIDQPDISQNEAKLKFKIYGNHDDDDLSEFVFAKVAELDCLEYEGTFTQDDRSKIFSQIDVMAIPSIGENYPFIIREALYANIPVIATNISGVPEIIANGVNGFLFPPGDFKSLAALFEKITKQPDLLNELDLTSFPAKTISEEAIELIKEFKNLPESKSEQPLVSIVIVTYNSEATIRKCLQSIHLNTTISYEIILIDNASNKNVKEVINNNLEFRIPITIIQNDENAGFSKASNQGIQQARGKYVVLLNPDTAVLQGWAEQLIAHFNNEVGAVGPISNYAAGLQNVNEHIDKKLHGNFSVEELSARIYQTNNGKSIETKLLIGFCMMIKKETIDKVGLLDENLILGNDDLDYSLRLRDAGYKLLIATDTFIYHEGQSSFAMLKSAEKQQMMQMSLDRFYAKLETKYGEGKVPSSIQLWGLDILGIPSKFTEGLKPLLKVPKSLSIKKRIALIYDNAARPDTTGEYCKRALCQICQTDHFLPSQIASLTPGSYDLFLFIDDGLNYAIPYYLRPNAWWVIDTHLQYNVDLQKSRKFDFVFAAQKDGAAKLKRDGINNVKWLPLAADPEIHKKHQVNKEYDISFIGHYAHGPRNKLLQIIKSNFDNVYIGQQFFEEMAKTYSASKIIFNRSLKNDINMRVFEAMSTGSLLVTNDVSDNGILEIFQDEQVLVQYSSEAELLKKLKYYLKEEKKREFIAEKGRKNILANHTYTHRMKVLLSEVFENDDTVMRPTPDELVSIILVTFNGLEATKNCIESIHKYTNISYELIIVDNGSTDGTLEYIDSLSNAKTIHNQKNLGFSAANNIGIKNSKGDYILLLNNDTIVTEGWLNGLLRAINLAPEVGLAGPKTNWVFSSSQIVDSPKYKSQAELQTYAKGFTNQHKNEYLLTNEILVGFCLLIKKEVIDKIGLLDERFGNGNFEDDDYCLRARLAGYEKIVAGDVFIHHEGNFSFKANNIDYQDQMEQNLLLFKEKWKDEIEFRGRKYFLKKDLEALAQTENIRGENAFEKNRLENAKEHFEKALEWDPEYVVALNNLGVLNWQLGNTSDAADYFLNALEKDSKYLDAIENLMQIIPNLNMNDEVMQKFTEICKDSNLVVS